MCQACNHQDRASLDADLRAGMRPGEAGKKYGLRPSGVYQHGRLHIESIESRGPDEHAKPRQSTNERMVEPPAIDFSINGEDTPLPARRPVAPAAIYPIVLMRRRPLAMVQEAWQDAKDDEAERARIVAWLNEQLQADDREF